MSTGVLPGSTVWVAGNGSAVPYTDNGNPDPRLTERFPITVPPGVKVQYWDKNQWLPYLLPPPAVFLPGVGTNASCIILDASHSTNVVQLRGYLNANLQSNPDINQGFVVREFQKAVSVSLPTSIIDNPIYRFVLDGIQVLDCQQSLFLTGNSVQFEGLLQRSYLRSCPVGGTFPPAKQLIEVSVNDYLDNGPKSVSLSIQSVDLRTKGQPLQSSMVTADVDLQTDDFFELEMKNCVINGRTDQPTIPPATPNKIQGAGVELALRRQSHGRIEFDNVKILDCQGDGVLATAAGIGSIGEFFSRYSTFQENGADQSITPVLNISDFAESGVHLALFEGGNWTIADVDRSHFPSNHRHGLYLDGAGDELHASSFGLVEITQSEFTGNGLALTGTEEGHGVYARMHAAAINAEMHQTALIGNRTCGVRYTLEQSPTFSAHTLDITNSVLSLNLGQGANAESERAPITILSDAPIHRCTFHLSNVTVSDNATTYAVSLDQRGANSPTEATWLWDPVNTIDNSILISNGGPVGDQAFYPEPIQDLTALHLWNLLFFSSYWSNLGSNGSAFPLYYDLSPNNCYDYPPDLVPITLGNLYLGEVFPGTVMTPNPSMIDFGGGPVVFAAENDDVRGPVHPRVVDHPLQNAYSGRDRGAFEAQPNEP